jgi:hypothetical protein
LVPRDRVGRLCWRRHIIWLHRLDCFDRLCVCLLFQHWARLPRILRLSCWHRPALCLVLLCDQRCLLLHVQLADRTRVIIYVDDCIFISISKVYIYSPSRTLISLRLESSSLTVSRWTTIFGGVPDLYIGDFKLLLFFRAWLKPHRLESGYITTRKIPSFQDGEEFWQIILM